MRWTSHNGLLLLDVQLAKDRLVGLKLEQLTRLDDVSDFQLNLWPFMDAELRPLVVWLPKKRRHNVAFLIPTFFRQT